MNEAIDLACNVLIKPFEGLARKRLDGLIEAYPDPGSGGAPWTIGYGSTGPDITPHTVWTLLILNNTISTTNTIALTFGALNVSKNV